jgi:hypothetical protein
VNNFIDKVVDRKMVVVESSSHGPVTLNPSLARMFELVKVTANSPGTILPVAYVNLFDHLMSEVDMSEAFETAVLFSPRRIDMISLQLQQVEAGLHGLLYTHTGAEVTPVGYCPTGIHFFLNHRVAPGVNLMDMAVQHGLMSSDLLRKSVSQSAATFLESAKRGCPVCWEMTRCPFYKGVDQTSNHTSTALTDEVFLGRMKVLTMAPVAGTVQAAGRVTSVSVHRTEIPNTVITEVGDFGMFPAVRADLGRRT